MSKKPLEPFIVSDPMDLAFLHVVRSLPPGSLVDLAKAMRMTVKHAPAHKTRAAWCRFYQAAGYPQTEWRQRADQIMTSGIAALVRNK